MDLWLENLITNELLASKQRNNPGHKDMAPKANQHSSNLNEKKMTKNEQADE